MKKATQKQVEEAYQGSVLKRNRVDALDGTCSLKSVSRSMQNNRGEMQQFFGAWIVLYCSSDIAQGDMGAKHQRL